jgi:hypothetical protein
LPKKKNCKKNVKEAQKSIILGNLHGEILGSLLDLYKLARAITANPETHYAKAYIYVNCNANVQTFDEAPT